MARRGARRTLEQRRRYGKRFTAASRPRAFGHKKSGAGTKKSAGPISLPEYRRPRNLLAAPQEPYQWRINAPMWAAPALATASGS